MSFRFRLQTIQKLREQSRQECRLALAEAYAKEEELTQQEQAVQLLLQQNENQVREESQHALLQVDTLIHGRRYEVILKMQLAELAAQKQALTSIVEERRQALLHAEREVKILEKLQERQFSRYMQGFEKLEALELSEAALRGYRQRNAEVDA